MPGNQIYKVYNFILISVDLEPKIAQETCTEVFLKAELTEKQETTIELYKYASNHIHNTYPINVIATLPAAEPGFSALLPEEIAISPVVSSEQASLVWQEFKLLPRLARQIIWLLCKDNLSIGSVESILGISEEILLSTYTAAIYKLVHGITNDGADLASIANIQHAKVFESIKKLAYTPELLPSSGYKQELTNLLATQKPNIKEDLPLPVLQNSPAVPFALNTQGLKQLLQKINWKNLALILFALVLSLVVVAAASYSLLNNNSTVPSNPVAITVQEDSVALTDFEDSETGIKIKIPSQWTTTTNNNFPEYPLGNKDLAPASKRIINLGETLNITTANPNYSFLLGSTAKSNNTFTPVSIGNKLVVFNSVGFSSQPTGCNNYSNLTTYFAEIFTGITVFFTNTDRYECVEGQVKLVESSLDDKAIQIIRTSLESLQYNPVIAAFKDYNNEPFGFKTIYPSNWELIEPASMLSVKDTADLKPTSFSASDISGACNEFKQANLAKLGTDSKVQMQLNKSACIIYPSKNAGKQAGMVFGLPNSAFVNYTNVNYWSGFVNLENAVQIFNDSQVLTPTSKDPYPGQLVVNTTEYVVRYPTNYVATFNNTITPYTYKLTSGTSATISFSNQDTSASVEYDYNVIVPAQYTVGSETINYNVYYRHKCPVTGPVCPPVSTPISPVAAQVVSIVAKIITKYKISDGSNLQVTVQRVFSPSNAGTVGIKAWEKDLEEAITIIKTLTDK